MSTPAPDAAAASERYAAVPEPRRRKAWRPEADDEVAALLRRLAATPWLAGGRNDEAIVAVRRNESALRSALARMGWLLVVERDLVRLRKSPPPRPDVWAARGPKPAEACWFFLLVAAAESMPPRVGIGQLVTAARSAAAEAGVPAINDIGERRAIVAALRMLDERGIVERLDGDLDGYLADEHAPVLLAVHHTRLAHVVANPGTIDPAVDPHAWLAQVHREPDTARRMRRTLIDDTCVHAADLDDAEAAWLSQRVRGDDGAPLAAAFGLTLERRAEGAAFVVPEQGYRHFRELGPVPFPVPGTVAHAALLLVEHASIHGCTTGPGPGWRGLSGQDVRTALATFAADNISGRGGWGAEYAADPALLADRVADLLTGANLARITAAHSSRTVTDAAALTADIGSPDPEHGSEIMWWFAPVTGRWSEEGTATPVAGRHRARREAGSRAQAGAGSPSVSSQGTAAGEDLFSTIAETDAGTASWTPSAEGPPA